MLHVCAQLGFGMLHSVTCVCSARIRDVTQCYVCAHDQVAAETNDPPPGVNCSALSWRCSHCHRED